MISWSSITGTQHLLCNPKFMSPDAELGLGDTERVIEIHWNFSTSDRQLFHTHFGIQVISCCSWSFTMTEAAARPKSSAFRYW